MSLPRTEREALLKCGFESAEGSTRQRASVWTGTRGDKERRAWRALSRDDLVARLGGGDGKGVGFGLSLSSSKSG